MPMLKYVRLVFVCGPRILWDFAFFINRYARHPEKYPLQVRFDRVKNLVAYLEKHFRLDMKIEGADYIKELEKEDKRFLLVSDHLSYFDPLSFMPFCEKPLSFVAKKEARKMPFIGTAIKSLDGIFLDREDLRASLASMKLVEKRLSEGYCSYAIFPEGTRNKTPEKGVAPFHPGSFKPATTLGVPLLPVAVYGTPFVFAKRPDYKRLPLEYTFFKPMDVKGQMTTDVAPVVYKMIAGQYAKDGAEEKDFFAKGFDKVPLRKGKVR